MIRCGLGAVDSTDQGCCCPAMATVFLIFRRYENDSYAAAFCNEHYELVRNEPHEQMTEREYLFARFTPNEVRSRN